MKRCCAYDPDRASSNPLVPTFIEGYEGMGSKRWGKGKDKEKEREGQGVGILLRGRGLTDPRREKCKKAAEDSLAMMKEVMGLVGGGGGGLVGGGGGGMMVEGLGFDHPGPAIHPRTTATLPHTLPGLPWGGAPPQPSAHGADGSAEGVFDDERDGMEDLVDSLLHDLGMPSLLRGPGRGKGSARRRREGRGKGAVRGERSHLPGQQVKNSDGWQQGMGVASFRAASEARAAALEKVGEIERGGRVAGVKEMSESQVSGGFWCQLPMQFASAFDHNGDKLTMSLINGDDEGDSTNVIFLPRLVLEGPVMICCQTS